MMGPSARLQQLRLVDMEEPVHIADAADLIPEGLRPALFLLSAH